MVLQAGLPGVPGAPELLILLLVLLFLGGGAIVVVGGVVAFYLYVVRVDGSDEPDG